MQPGRLTDLLQAYLQDNCSEAEKQELAQLIAQAGDEALDKALEPLWADYTSSRTMSRQEADALLADILYPSRARILPLRRIGWAAAIILLIATGTVLYRWNRQTDKSAVATATARPMNDILPGKQGAILTLSDGSTRVLDSLNNGLVATQGVTRIILQNGQVSYTSGKDGRLSEEKGQQKDGQLPDNEGNRSENKGQGRGDKTERPAAMAYNTMTTPRGRQYQLVLPDGTKVWLNAASSITYPTVFAGGQRKVTITGEAFFEVTHNARQPFIVKAGAQEIEDIGTSFNVNAYSDEAAITTTLVQGSVRVRDRVLKPGQQSRLAPDGKFSLVDNADIDAATAWKDGRFYFNGIALPVLMRQISRWYDVEVVFDGPAPDGHYVGSPSRNLTAVQMLKLLESEGIRFSMEGKKIIIRE